MGYFCCATAGKDIVFFLFEWNGVCHIGGAFIKLAQKLSTVCNFCSEFEITNNLWFLLTISLSKMLNNFFKVGGNNNE